MPLWSEIEGVEYNDNDIYVTYLNDNEVWRKKFNVTITLDDTISKVDCFIYNQNEEYIEKQSLTGSQTITVKYDYKIKLQVTPNYKEPYSEISDAYTITINNESYSCTTNTYYEKNIKISGNTYLTIGTAIPKDINKAANLLLHYFYCKLDDSNNLYGYLTTNTGAFYDSLTYKFYNNVSDSLANVKMTVDSKTRLKLSNIIYEDTNKVIPILIITDTKYNLETKYQHHIERLHPC